MKKKTEKRCLILLASLIQSSLVTSHPEAADLVALSCSLIAMNAGPLQ